jgi:hypothetical protein
MSDEAQGDRRDRLVAEIEKLPHDEREAVIAALSEEDRAAVWRVEEEKDQEEPIPPDGELGSGD